MRSFRAFLDRCHDAIGKIAPDVERRLRAAEDVGRELLMASADGDHLACLRLLKETPSKQALRSSLLLAAEFGRIECVRILAPLAARQPKTSERNRHPQPENEQAIHKSAANGHAECVKIILSHSRPDDVHAYTRALCWAARGGHSECVKLLLPFSNPLADDSLALCMASRNGHRDCAELLIPFSDPKDLVNALEEAALAGNPECMELIIATASSGGRCPLTALSGAFDWAARSGRAEAVNCLLIAGCKPSSSTINQAIVGGDLNIIGALLAQSPEMIELLDFPDLRALATRAGHGDAVELLLALEEQRALGDAKADLGTARSTTRTRL